MAIDESEELPILSAASRESFGDDVSQIREAAIRFISNLNFAEPQKWALEPLNQGLSGGTVIRCAHPRGDFALKRWPATTTENRLDEVHRVLKFAAKSLELMPELHPWRESETRLSIRKSHFDFSEWKKGQEFDGSFELTSAVNLGAAAIARFHRSTVELGSQMGVAPAVIQRIERLASLEDVLPFAIKQAKFCGDSIRQAGRFLASHWKTMHRKNASILAKWSDRKVPIQWVLRDVHREHVLFDCGKVTGMVDFDAVKRDTPATDLARWVGSFVESEVPAEMLWSEAFSGYESTNAISAREQELASAIERVSRYIQLANWVVWVAGENRIFPCGNQGIDDRVTRLLRFCNDN